MKNKNKLITRFTLLVILLFSLLLIPEKQIAAKKIKLNKKTVYLLKGSKYKLKVKGTGKKAKWKSSDPNVVKVSKKGKIKGMNYGSATIIAKVNGKKLKCKVFVETKEARKARKLRDYILKKGKYSKSKRIYYLKWEFDDDSFNHFVFRISTSKKKKVLDFYYKYSPEAPDEDITTEMSIDLISGKTAVKSGTVKSHYYYPDDWADDNYYANITTEFDGKEKGVTPTKLIQQVEQYPDPSYKTITDASTLATYKTYVAYRMNYAFNGWNRLLRKYKTLKKAKINMTSIGFTKWKDGTY